MDKNRRIYKSRTEKKWAGVCGGIAEYFEIDPTLIRILFLVATFFTGIFPGLILYVALLVVMPYEPY